MSANLPVPALGGILTRAADHVLQNVRVESEAEQAALRVLSKTMDRAGSAAERADKHVQKWREGMARMTLEVAVTDDPALDEAFRLIQRTGAWKILQAAALESPRIMAELRSYWNPEDKVEIRE